MYPRLPKSYKGAFPFKIGSTSFIYPDHYATNVEMLGPYLDEIELLVFESAHAESLPSKREIEKLRGLAEEFEITYNIHLPTDISLGHPDPSMRQHAVDTIKRVIDRTAPLSPSTHTLHLAYDEAKTDEESVTKWRDLISSSLNRLLSDGLNSKALSIETLEYPFEWVDTVIAAFDLTVCMDLGHLFLFGYDSQATFEKHAGRTVIIHLHGVHQDRDHVSLDRLPPKSLNTVQEILKGFTGTVSLEVFSYHDLAASLPVLENCRQKLKI